MTAPAPLAPPFDPADLDGWVDEATVESDAPKYPQGQWKNGKTGYPKTSINFTGGPVLPLLRPMGKDKKVDNLPPDLALPGFVQETVEFESGGVDEALVATGPIEVALIRMRRCWMVKREGDPPLYFPWTTPYQDKFRGHYEVLLVVRGRPDFPVAMTFNATNSQAYDQVLRDLDTLAVKASALFNMKKRLPRWALWATLKAGPHAKPNPGYPSKTTPPILVMPPTLNLEWAQNAFVGRGARAVYDQIATHFKAAEPWVTEYVNGTAFGASVPSVTLEVK